MARPPLSTLAGLFVAVSAVLALGTGLLGHLGLFDPPLDTESSCTLTEELVCLNATVREDSVVLVLGNNIGRTVFFEDIVVQERWGRQRCTFDSSLRPELFLVQGEIVTLTSDQCIWSRVSPGKKYSYDLRLDVRVQGRKKGERIGGRMVWEVGGQG